MLNEVVQATARGIGGTLALAIVFGIPAVAIGKTIIDALT